MRPGGYRYFDILKDHLGGDLTKVFNGKLIYPRQLEIHLPADHKKSCNFNCYYCQGRILEQPLGSFELDVLELCYKLQGKVPYMIYGGAYTEPLMNPHLLTFIAMTKRFGSNWGIHTNGSLLAPLEKLQGWVSELCTLSDNPGDYLSISLDAGCSESHMRTKRLKQDYFTTITEGIRLAVKARGNRNYPAVRVCYLLNKFNSSSREIETIIKIAKSIKVDSLKFSIPYDLYGIAFGKVKEYKKNIENKQNEIYKRMLEPLMSKNGEDRPYIFYISPFHQDVERMNYNQCVYGYYQITFGADGYVYKCSSGASPTFKKIRLGKATNDLDEFNKMVLANEDPNFNPSVCWKEKARCNRMALACNKGYAEWI